jgi:hypothetical protein
MEVPVEAGNIERAHPEGVLAVDHVLRVATVVHVFLRVCIQMLLDSFAVCLASI